MKVRILRGSNQIGGSLVEIAHGGSRIVLEVGLPLDPVPYRDLLPDVPGLWSSGDGSLLGVFVSHGHPDHYGLADLVSPDVPVFMGGLAKDILDQAGFFTRSRSSFEIGGVLSDRCPIQVGPFKVTPHRVDHSAPDSFALLVEAGDESLLYSGDIRFQGLEPAEIGAPISGGTIDTLLLEGTTFGRRDRTARFAAEEDLATHLAERFRATEGASLVFFSSQNLERLRTVFDASRDADRTLVLDLYTATMAKLAATSSNLPFADSMKDGLARARVFVPPNQRQGIIETEEFSRIKEIRASRIFLEEIADDPSLWTIVARTSYLRSLDRAGCLEGSRAFWMMWSGYLDRGSARRLFSELGVGVEIAHFSGHATPNELVKFGRSVGARQVVPIHTDSPGAFARTVERATLRNDGEWWEVAASSCPDRKEMV